MPVTTVAEHNGERITGRVAYLDDLTPEEARELIPAMGFTLPDTVYLFNGRIPGEVVELSELLAV